MKPSIVFSLETSSNLALKTFVNYTHLVLFFKPPIHETVEIFKLKRFLLTLVKL